MPVNATPGDPGATSYETAEEFAAYLATKPGAVAPKPEDVDALLVQATRLLDNTLAGPPDLTLAAAQGQVVVYAWTQLPTSATQALAWPRVNERNRNGQPIPPEVVPQGVKDCVSEIVLAGASGKDLTASNDVVVQGIKSVSAGSVAVSFKDSAAGDVPADVRMRASVLPDAAWLCLVPSWYQWNVPATLAAQGQGGRATGFDFAVT